MLCRPYVTVDNLEASRPHAQTINDPRCKRSLSCCCAISMLLVVMIHVPMSSALEQVLSMPPQLFVLALRTQVLCQHIESWAYTFRENICIHVTSLSSCLSNTPCSYQPCQWKELIAIARGPHRALPHLCWPWLCETWWKKGPKNCIHDSLHTHPPTNDIFL